MKERGRPRSFDKDAALARAMETFWQKGYEGASMTDLTAAMGIASPSLYAAFGSKEGLFREALALYGATESADIWGPLKEAPTARDAIEGFLMQTARAFTRPDKPKGCLVILSALHPTETRESVGRELVRMRSDKIDDLVERLTLGVESGEIDPHADIRAVAIYYATVQQGMAIQARDGASREALEAIAKAALSAWEPLTGGVA